MSEDRKISILEHLRELRKRMTYAAIGVAITTALSFIFVPRIIEILIRPIEGTRLVFTELTQMLGAYMTVGFLSGIVLGLPFFVYQFLLFIAPALTPAEKKYVYILLPSVLLAFGIGACFGYFVLIPPALKFLVSFGSDLVTPLITINSYISLVTKLLFAIGMVFEMPIVIFFLAKMHIVTPRFLSKNRRWAVLIAFLAGAMITPTFDPVNQTLVAVPIIVLYEISIWLARLAWLGSNKKTEVKKVPSVT